MCFSKFIFNCYKKVKKFKPDPILVILAILAGIITALAFPPYNFIPGVFIGPLIFYVMNRKKLSFYSGFLFGIGFLAPIENWLFEFNFFAPFAVIFIFAIPYGVAARFSRTPLLFASAMTAAEFFRCIGSFAFPWGQLGSVLAFKSFANLFYLFGVFGVTFIVLLTASLSVEKFRLALIFAGTVFLIILYPQSELHGQKIKVAVVQGNFAPESDYEFEPQKVLSRLFLGTREAAQKGAKLVVWTETVILEYLNLPSSVRRSIERLAIENNITIITGAPSLIEGDKRNSIYVFFPDSNAIKIFRYDKVHLVPFGEYIPGFGPDKNHLLLSEGVGDFTPAILSLPKLSMAFMICFEGAFSEVASVQVNNRAKLLVNLSNDAWSKSSSEAVQHAALTGVRAFEFRSALIRAGNTGPSFILDADGTEKARLDLCREGVITGEVTLSEKSSRFVSVNFFGWLNFLGLPFFLTASSLLGELKERNE